MTLRKYKPLLVCVICGRSSVVAVNAMSTPEEKRRQGSARSVQTGLYINEDF